MHQKQTGKKLVGLCVLFAALLNYPILGMFSERGTVGGVPVLAVGVFGIWGLLIGLSALVLARGKKRDKTREL